MPMLRSGLLDNTVSGDTQREQCHRLTWNIFNKHEQHSLPGKHNSTSLHNKNNDNTEQKSAHVADGEAQKLA